MDFRKRRHSAPTSTNEPSQMYATIRPERSRLVIALGSLLTFFILAAIGLAIGLGIVATQSKNSEIESTITVTVTPSPTTAEISTTSTSKAHTSTSSSKTTTPVIAPVPPAELRIDCQPDQKIPTEEKCNERHCRWDGVSFPFCYYGSDTGFKVKKAEGLNTIFLEPISSAGPFGQMLNVTLNYEFLSDGSLLHFRLTDTNNPDRYEVVAPSGPVPIWPKRKPNLAADSSLLDFVWQPDPFSFQIVRKQTRSVLWDSSLGGFVFSDQFLQITTKLPSDRLYGFGENTHQSLKHNMRTFKNWYLFARDEPPDSTEENHKNLYGVHPFFLCFEADGNAFGVVLLNSNAQEYQTTPAPGLVYRSIGGIFDFYLFSGPKPADVIRQYWGLIGHPVMPSYWALGFQLCRYGYQNLQEVKDVVNRNRAAGIPQDVQYVDIDYMDRYRDFTQDNVKFSGLADYIQELHSMGLKVILILDPAINVYDPSSNYSALQTGLTQDVFAKWPNDTDPQNLILTQNYTTNGTDIMLGTVWPDEHVAFPNWFNDRTSEWWASQIVQFSNHLPFDGLWIDMNEPANFGTNEDKPWYFGTGKPEIPTLKCPRSSWDDPPYPTGAVPYFRGDGSFNENTSRISEKTLCMIAEFEASNGRIYRHYDVHNLYGWAETGSTFEGAKKATGKRSVVITRSTFPSSGKYGGHWLGDNSATWDDMRTSIIGMIEFNMFGLPYVGADICGFNGNTTEELCLRWQQLGSFYPFSRNHNSKGCPDATNFLCQPQDPAALGELVATATRIALSFRYRFLPYLYSLFYLANTIGTPVINALWMPFSTDNNTIDIDRQFLWGEAMLITPVLQPGAEVVDVYLPYTGDDNDAWYSVRNDSDYGKWYKGGQFLTSHPASNTSLIPVFLRSGWVFPCQQPELTTSLSRQNPLELIITAKTPTDHFITASGVFYWDEGDNLDYQTNSVFSTIEVTTHAISNKTFLSFNNQGNFNISPLQIPSLSQVQIFGYLWQSAPIEFVSDSIVRLDANSTILDNGVLTIKFHPYLLLNSSFAVISWQNTD